MATYDTAEDSRLIGGRAASKEYGIKYTSLRNIVHGGEIPHIRIGRAIYLDRRDIEGWIESKKQRG